MKKTLIILILFITGCVKYTDLHELSIIKSIGISYNESYTLYSMIYDEIKKDNEPKTIIIETTGKTIKEVFEKLKKESNKELFLSHIDLFLLDVNLNKNNYDEIINYFTNNNEFRNDFYCLFTNEIKSILNNSKYNEIENYLKSNKENKNIIKITFDEVIENYLQNKSFTLSMINYENKIKYQGNYQYNQKNRKDNK